jgi:hypothetical protein
MNSSREVIACIVLGFIAFRAKFGGATLTTCRGLGRVLTHLVSDGEVGLFLFQLLTASLVLQHGSHRLFHSETEEVYEVTNKVSTANLERIKRAKQIFLFHQLKKVIPVHMGVFNGSSTAVC